MGYLRFAVLVILLGGCGANLPYSLTDPPPANRVLKGQVDFVNFSSTDLQMIHKPYILMFASEGCIPCNEEVAGLVQYFKSGLPKNVRLISILNGGQMNRAAKWKLRYEVPWSVGINTGDVMFYDLCRPEGTTPCVYTVNFGSHHAITRHIGKTAIAELEKETGPWTY